MSQNETYLRTEDIVDVLRREGHQIALVMLGGVHYYTGQYFDIETITRVAHEQVIQSNLTSCFYRTKNLQTNRVAVLGGTWHMQLVMFH